MNTLVVDHESTVKKVGAIPCGSLSYPLFAFRNVGLGNFMTVAEKVVYKVIFMAGVKQSLLCLPGTYEMVSLKVFIGRINII